MGAQKMFTHAIVIAPNKHMNVQHKSRTLLKHPVSFVVAVSNTIAEETPNASYASDTLTNLGKDTKSSRVAPSASRAQKTDRRKKVRFLLLITYMGFFTIRRLIRGQMSNAREREKRYFLGMEKRVRCHYQNSNFFFTSLQDSKDHIPPVVGCVIARREPPVYENRMMD